MVHVSKLDRKHIDKAGDVVKVGDEIMVKYIGKDKKGRHNFSRRDAIKELSKEDKKKKDKKSEEEA